jgi:hypothetical protein
VVKVGELHCCRAIVLEAGVPSQGRDPHLEGDGGVASSLRSSPQRLSRHPGGGGVAVEVAIVFETRALRLSRRRCLEFGPSCLRQYLCLESEAIVFGRGPHVLGGEIVLTFHSPSFSR